MKNLITLFFSITFSFVLFSQTDQVKGEITTIDTADLKILNIYPDSFPNVSVVFRAEKRNGDPVWDLTKEKMMVTENSEPCEVISLEQISKNRPINLGIVIDHSGSMLEDFSQLYDDDGKPIFTYDDLGWIIPPEGYVPPIDNAKTAVKSFVSTFDTEKDFISIIGFSETVDKRLPLTQDVAQIEAIVNSMEADYSTALYDAMMAGINEVKDAEGVKVLIVLTDGHDNASTSTYEEVIDYASEENIPLYIIGLGDVNAPLLNTIAKSTNGNFYYTKSSNSLNDIYAKISTQVQAFYELVYSSPNFSEIDTTRQVELSFNIDDVFLVSEALTIDLPEEVVEYLKEKSLEIEEELEFEISEENEDQGNGLYVGIAIVVLISAGTLLFYLLAKKRKKNEPIIHKLYPNPSKGNINLEYESKPGKLNIVNISGHVAKTFEIDGNETKFDLTDIEDGTYIATIQADGKQSNGVKFLLQK